MLVIVMVPLPPRLTVSAEVLTGKDKIQSDHIIISGPDLQASETLTSEFGEVIQWLQFVDRS